MICFACDQPGHKASYCQAKKQNPNKDLAMANIRKVGEHHNWPVSSPLAPKCMKGEVNGRTATILVDSGTQRTIVKASLVNAADFTGESIPITTFILEEAVSRPLADITTTTANITLGVDDHMMMGSEDVLLSISLGSTEKLADLLLDGEPYMPNLPAVTNVTRAQEKHAVTEDEAGAAQESLDDIHLIAIDEAARTDETKERPQGVEDAIIPDDEQVEESPPLTPTLVHTIQTLDCPLVHPGGIPSAELQAAMREDEALQAWRAKADDSLDGFYWDDCLLMKTITTNLEEQRELLIMPREFWPRLLKTAHDRQGRSPASTSVMTHVTSGRDPVVPQLRYVSAQP